jgi:preprotein translocase subunit SecF
MSRLSTLTHGLYTGQTNFAIVANRRKWYAFSALLLVISIGALAFRGLNFSIEFSGGSQLSVPSATCTVEQARQAFVSSGVTTEAPIVTVTQGSLGRNVNVQTVSLTPAQTKQAQQALADGCQTDVTSITTQVVGPSWGQQITRKAVIGLVVFLAAIVVYLSIVFEWRMAVAALVALTHDIVITVGVYALIGFEVSPATVIGVLTILGYSLYDTVVVFDKVNENTRGITAAARLTYEQAANRAVNQTLVRSLNTSIVGLLPVASLLFVGAYVLGAGTLKDLALALFVGIAIGTYSSICVATPVLVDLKNREPAIAALNRRVAQRDAVRAGAVAAAAERGESESDDPDAVAAAAVAAVAGGDVPRGPRNQPRRATSKKKRKR